MAVVRGKQIVLRAVQTCTSFFAGARGLRFYRAFPGDGLLLTLPFSSRIGATIDMLFVRFPIDVVWMDEHTRIVDIRSSVKPWRIAIPKTKARYILEVPYGKGKRFSVGEKIRISD